jgi:hypothetical protein
VKKLVFIVSFVILLKPVLPVVDYIINYEYISKVLCVNKAKPAMHCNGKCHLMKELAKAAENEKPISSDKKNTTQEVEVLFFEKINGYHLDFFCDRTIQKINSNYSNLYSYLNRTSVFHPPTFVS